MPSQCVREFLLLVCIGMVHAANPTCADLKCPSGWSMIPWMAPQGNPTVEECCEKTCALFDKCPPGKAPDPLATESSYFHEENCCVPTCEYLSCPKGHDKNPKTLNDLKVSDDNCCMPTCGIHHCPNGYQHIEGMKAKFGDSDDICCEKTCAALVCDDGSLPNPAMIGSTKVDQETCCEKTCEFHKCGEFWVSLPNKSDYRPKAHEWNNPSTFIETHCCTNTCRTAPGGQAFCDAGYVLKNFDSTKVTKENCCQKTCKAHTCPDGYVLDEEKSSSFGLSDAECCKPTCARYSCPTGWTVDESKKKLTELTVETCCALTCDGFTCPEKRAKNISDEKHKEYPPSNEACCVDTCENTRCPVGTLPNPKQLKSTNTGQENCCLKTCAGHKCPEGYITNKDKKNVFARSDAQCCLPTCARHKCPFGYKIAHGKREETIVNDRNCCLPTCRNLACDPGHKKIPDKEDAILPKENAEKMCCEIDYMDVSDSFLKGGKLMEVVTMRKDGGQVDTKCCCKKDTTMCELRSWGVGMAKGCGSSGWVGWHNFFDKEAEFTLPVKRPCMIAALEADLFSDNIVG